MSSLKALEALLLPKEFWSPGGIGRLPIEAQHAYVLKILDESQASDGQAPAGGENAFERAQSLLSTPPWERIQSMSAWFDSKDLSWGDASPHRPRHALCWVAGLPYALLEGVGRPSMNLNGFPSLHVDGTLWIPEHLVVPGYLPMDDWKGTELPRGLEVQKYLWASRSAIARIGEGLKVGGDLMIDHTAVSDLPHGIEVGGYLGIAGTPLAAWSEEAILERVKVGKGILWN
jgi:hypothetical protein